MTRQFLSLTAFIVATTLTQHPVTAAKRAASPSIIDLGTLGTFSDAFGINNDPDNIQVVGMSTLADGFTHGFFWTAATRMIDLGSLGRGSDAMDINNHGVIAGGSEDAARARWAVVWTMSSGVWTIEKLGAGRANGLNNGTGGDPSAIAVVGSSAVSGEFHAVMWKKGPTEWLIEDLGTLPGDMTSSANDVNDSETVVGMSMSSTLMQRAFRWTPSTGMVALPGLGGDTTAVAIGSNGDVAGTSTDGAGNQHAVRWLAADNAIQDLGTLGGCCSGGFGINTAGTVVGVSDLGGRRGSQHAFLAKPGARITDLGALRGQSGARDLNDFGTIVGGSGNGQLHAAIWKLP
jgi:probable HAF family extracellular repeat protein